MEGRDFKTFNLAELCETVQKVGEHYLDGIHFLGTKKPYPENMPPLW
jgi:hypothetical protein